MAHYTDEIKALESIVNASLDQITVDGVTTRINIEMARKRLRELRALHPGESTMVRPAVSGMRLGSSW